MPWPHAKTLDVFDKHLKPLLTQIENFLRAVATSFLHSVPSLPQGIPFGTANCFSTCACVTDRCRQVQVAQNRYVIPAPHCGAGRESNQPCIDVVTAAATTAHQAVNPLLRHRPAPSSSMSKRLVKRLSPAGKPGNLNKRESIVVDTGIVHHANQEVTRARTAIPFLSY